MYNLFVFAKGNQRLANGIAVILHISALVVGLKLH